ncbi:MAG: tryptophan 7-halogenase [Proteobacteria bacterium]|nr:tryptophan 7-halogenase [Pseudomonadota bacterium]
MSAARRERFDVLVLGAGPAGAAAALGALRLGYRTAVIARALPHGVEGLSARALASIRAAGFTAHAADWTSAPAARLVWWAGERSWRGQEAIVDRSRLASCQCAALQESGVQMLQGTVREVQSAGQAWQVSTDAGAYQARAVLDARGRRARGSEQCGPALVAWSATQPTGRLLPAGTAVVALPEGWVWFARTANGMQSLQFVGAATERGARRQLVHRLQAAARLLPEFGLETLQLTALEGVTARAAVARYSRPSRGCGWLRIGDAAVAMDPLSGNGIHEATGSARVAIAAINSYLQGARWPMLAQFVDQRAAELWRRSVTTAAAFYRQQARHDGGKFWRDAAAVYEQLGAAARPPQPGPGRFEVRPVLDGSRIVPGRVWVDSQWPRGIWQVDRHVLAQLPPTLLPSVLRRASRAAQHEGPR